MNRAERLVLARLQINLIIFEVPQQGMRKYHLFSLPAGLLDSCAGQDTAYGIGEWHSNHCLQFVVVS